MGLYHDMGYKLHSTSFNYYTNWEIQLISWDSKTEFPWDFGTWILNVFFVGMNMMNTLRYCQTWQKRESTIDPAWSTNSLRTWSHGPVEIVDLWIYPYLSIKNSDVPQSVRWSGRVCMDFPSFQTPFRGFSSHENWFASVHLTIW